MKVLVQRLNNGYLAHEGEGWGLTPDWSKATLFEYPKPGFVEQLRGLPDALGAIFVMVPVDALNFFEMCDRCGRLVRPLKAFFDGTQFLCPDCRTKVRGAESSVAAPRPEHN